MARTPGAKDTKPRQKATAGSKPSDKSPIIQDHNPDLPEGYNTRRIRFMQAILPTEPLDRDDVEEMETSIRLVHSVNAWEPIWVRVSGKVTSSRA